MTGRAGSNGYVRVFATLILGLVAGCSYGAPATVGPRLGQDGAFSRSGARHAGPHAQAPTAPPPAPAEAIDIGSRWGSGDGADEDDDGADEVPAADSSGVGDDDG